MYYYSRGMVKVWASHKAKSSHNNNSNSNNIDTMGIDAPHSSLMLNENFELLHTFRLFSKAVTGLTNHPIPGLCITSGILYIFLKYYKYL